MMTPYRQPGPNDQPLSRQENDFNIALSKTRVHIEIVFGKLKGRFRSLNRLPYKHKVNSIRHIRVCCFLHNWLVNQNDDVMEQWMRAQSEQEAAQAVMFRTQEESKEEADREPLYVIYNQHVRGPRPVRLNADIPLPIAQPWPLALSAEGQRRYDEYFRRRWQGREKSIKRLGHYIRKKITQSWF